MLFPTALSNVNAMIILLVSSSPSLLVPLSQGSLDGWTRCTALARIVHGDTHWMLALTHTQLAHEYMQKGQWELILSKYNNTLH